MTSKGLSFFIYCICQVLVMKLDKRCAALYSLILGFCARTTCIWHIYYCIFLTQHQDVTPPTFENSCPSDLSVPLDISGRATANWTVPVARDNSGEIPVVTVSPVGVYPPYEFNETTTITYTARDTSGNKKHCTFKITVEGNWKSHVSKSFL